jgi:ATP-dependent RNA helicase DDX3X
MQLTHLFCVGSNASEDHTFMMFSATFPANLRQIAREFMAVDYIRIRVGRSGSTHGNIKQQVVWLEENQKRQNLYDLMFSMPPARTLIFVNSRRQADLIDDFLYNQNLPSTAIHSERTQREREDSL